MRKFTGKALTYEAAAKVKEIAKQTGLNQYFILEKIINNAYYLMKLESSVSEFDNKELSNILLNQLKETQFEKQIAEKNLLSIRKKEKQINEALKSIGAKYE
jgi:MinD-like ATPase involved in chromosome partitioning or flagellar assembly